MLKKLAILILSLLIFPMQTYAEPDKAQQATKGDKPSLSTANVGQEQAQSPNLKTEHEDHVQADVWIVHPADKDGYDKAAFWISVGLVLVGMGAVYYAGRTLRAINEQADLMGKQVALMEVAISKERPRLSIEIIGFSLGEIPRLNYRLTCYGTTPAFILSSWEMTMVAPHPDFGWPKNAIGSPLRGLPETISNGVINSDAFIMGTKGLPENESSRRAKSTAGNFTSIFAFALSSKTSSTGRKTTRMNTFCLRFTDSAPALLPTLWAL